MFRYNVILAIRNMIKYWKYTLINIVGLSIGLCSFIFIFLYINDELQYDKFHKHADRIYRVNRWYNTKSTNEDAATCSFPCGPYLKKDYPQYVEEVVRFFNFQTNQVLIEYYKSNDTIIRNNETLFMLADSNVFQVFTFHFLKGNPETALDRPNSLVVTESTAKRYFGEESPVGKILRLEKYINMKITGVIKDLPSQSHFKIDFLGSLSTYREIQATPAPNKLLGALTRYRQHKKGRYPETWVWNPCWTYVLLKDGVESVALEGQMLNFYLAHYTDIRNQDITLYLQPVTDIHLKSNHAYEMHPNSDSIYIYILGSIGIIVLLLACINFMNLTTACSYTRIQEIGMKKVYGAVRGKLVLTFLGETFFQTLIALITAIIIIEIFLPLFNSYTGKHISSPFIFEPNVWILILVILILVSFISGIYPSYFLTALKPLQLCKRLPSKGRRTIKPRKILVISQFAISSSMIIGTLIIFSQLKYLKNAKLGFQTENIIIFKNDGDLTKKYYDFKKDLLDHKNIENVTGMEDILGINHNTRAYLIEGQNKGQKVYVPTFLVEWDFIETFNIEVVEGRAFSTAHPDDNVNAVMINETMARNMLWSNENAIGKNFFSENGNEKVIGVFKDFHVLSLHHPVNNFVLDMYIYPEEFARIIAVKTSNNNHSDVINHIHNVWNKYAPDRPFKYEYISDYHKNQYRNEDILGDLAVLLTILAIGIAVIGLVGLTSFLAEQRTKNISIRKVHGANFVAVLNLIMVEFTRLIIIANLIAWGLTYIIASLWLKGYTQHVSINFGIFIIAGITTLLLAFTIIYIKARKVYLKKTAVTLRYHF